MPPEQDQGHDCGTDDQRCDMVIIKFQVDDKYDSGKVLAQEIIPVEPGDTPESLAARVLGVEHRIYVKVLQDIVNGDIRLPGVTKI